MKTGTCILVDVELKALAKAKNINMSDIFNNALRAVLLSNSPKNHKELLKLENEIVELEKKIINFQTELEVKKTNLFSLKEKSRQETLNNTDKAVKFARGIINGGAVGDILD